MIGPTGHLTIVDVDQGMLDFTLARLRKHGLDMPTHTRCSGARTATR
jgi:ubiquinone/menaquinone biosynthesis C-methylase UbiE